MLRKKQKIKQKPKKQNPKPKAPNKTTANPAVKGLCVRSMGWVKPATGVRNVGL